MNDTVNIKFGTPEYGWLPVVFSFNDYKLELWASDVFNDSINEIYDTIIGLKEGKTGQVIWWLEPDTYILNFEKTDDIYILIISEAEDIHKTERVVTKIIKGNYDQIITPFKNALIEFCSQLFDEDQWEYSPDNNKLDLSSLDL